MNRLSLILLQFLIIPVCVGLADGFPVSKGFQRLDSFPLDTTSVFTNITDMSSYVSNNPVAYKGQLCTVVNSTNSNLYVISDTGESADWEKLPEAEDISDKLDTSVFTTHTNTYFPSDGTIVIATTPTTAYTQAGIEIKPQIADNLRSPYWWFTNDDNEKDSHKIWTEGTDGPGSGLNADLLDGLDSTGFHPAEDQGVSSSDIPTFGGLMIDGGFTHTVELGDEWSVESTMTGALLFNWTGNNYLTIDSGGNLIAQYAYDDSNEWYVLNRYLGDIRYQAKEDQRLSTSDDVTFSSMTASNSVLIGASARLVALTNGVALEVYNQSTTNWVRQAEWTE